jgi:cell division protein FtsQ
MVSLPHQDGPTPRRPHWRRSRMERRIADFRRFLIRHRLLVRFAVALAVAGIVAGAFALGLPRAVASGFAVVKTALAPEAGLKVEAITVDGLKNLTRAELNRVIEVPKGTPLLDVDVDRLRARVMSLAWVEDATILRVPPNRLHIAVKEYVPAMLWEHDGKFEAVDATGHVIAPVEWAHFSGLFQIRGKGAPKAAPALIAWLKALPEVGEHVALAVRVGERRWDLHLSNHLVIELPDRGLDEALATLTRMIKTGDLLRRDIRVLDLRDPKTPRAILNEQSDRAPVAPADKS